MYAAFPVVTEGAMTPPSGTNACLGSGSPTAWPSVSELPEVYAAAHAFTAVATGAGAETSVSAYQREPVGASLSVAIGASDGVPMTWAPDLGSLAICTSVVYV